MPLQVGGFGEPKKARVRKYVVGLYCGAAYHEVPFAQQQDCEVVRLYDVESDMCKLAELFFRRGGPRGDVVKQFDIRAETVPELHADVLSAVPEGERQWLHLNAGLPCNDGSKVNPRRDENRLIEHVATFFIIVQRMRSSFEKVTWFVEDVNCSAFVMAMKGLFPGAAHVVVDSARFTPERRVRAYFASPEFDLDALLQLDGGCTVEKWLQLDSKNGPYEMRSGSSGSKANCTWLSVARHAPTLTSNGLLGRNARTGEEWRVPSATMEAMRSLEPLPHTGDSIVARRKAVSRAITGQVSRAIAAQLRVLKPM